MGKPEEIAAVVQWLCADEAAFTIRQAMARRRPDSLTPTEREYAARIASDTQQFREITPLSGFRFRLHERPIELLIVAP